MSPAYAQNKVQVVVLKKSPKGELSVLLLQTNKDRGSFWQNMTGNLNRGEEKDEGAKRELQEETGLSEKDYAFYDLDYTFDYNSRHGGLAQENLFLVLLKKDCPISISALEHQAYEWVATTAIKVKSYFYPSNYEAFLKAMDYVKKNKL